MITTPRVTVLTPVYNGLPYLKESIESTLNQSMKDFELFVIVDGPEGNKDGSFECAQSYAARDSRVRVIMNEKNLGTAGTMNKGIELATAPIVARLDQDDISYPRRLESQFAYLKAHPELMIVSAWEYGIDAQTRKVRNWQAEISNYGAFLGPIVLGLCPIWHPSIMFYKEAMMTAGGYRKEYQPVEDFEATMRLGYLAYRGGVVPEYLVGQRHHGARQSVTKLEVQKVVRDTVHYKMIRRFISIPDQEGLQLGQFLGLSSLFWGTTHSKGEYYKIFELLAKFLEAVRSKLSLTDDEFKTMRDIVYARLGRGARYVKYLRYVPARIFSPVFFTLSPLLLPRVRSIAWTIHEFMQELRYPLRFLRGGLERRDK